MSLYKRSKDTKPSPLGAGLTAWAAVFGFIATCNAFGLLLNAMGN